MNPVVGNLYDKYGTRNPVARLLMRRFLNTVTSFAQSVSPTSLLEVGCGEGRLTQHLCDHLEEARFAACDLSLDRVDPSCLPRIDFREGSAYALPYADGAFDLVVCCEVLEHLDQPATAVVELARVTRRWAVISTPHEPLFRSLNLLRGAHMTRFGNTPGHLQHFGPRSLQRLILPHFRSARIATPLPWVVILAERIRSI